ncbi:MAG: hypothetical protein ABI830_12935 [Pseudolabrys sp.]
MKILSNLLIASALVASFAAPAFAAQSTVEGQTLVERTMINGTQQNDWSKAYAMEKPVQAPVTSNQHLYTGNDAFNG